jgi:uncharacterized SAM-binding protein YcdF (DUF218 family)
LIRRFLKNRRARIIALSAFALAAWWLIAWSAARFLIVSSDAPERADVIFVLSGAASYKERTRAAAQLFHEGRAPKIVLTNDGEQSGWSRAEKRNPLFVERAAQELERNGVPKDKIEILPTVVRHTTDEAALAHQEAEKVGWRSIIVVTSAYHTRRARLIWRDEFGDDAKIYFYAAPTGAQTPSPAMWWFHPRGWQMVAGEYMKMLFYAFGSSL